MNIYLPLALFCFSTSITPGPNNIMIMISGLNHGIRKSMPHFWGICLGFCFLIVVIGFGYGEIIHKLPILNIILNLVGSSYMLYLAGKIVFSSTMITSDSNNPPLTFIKAALFQWMNPKAWIIAIGAFATVSSNFINVSVAQTTMLITLVFFSFVLPCTAIWMLGGTMLKFILVNKFYLRAFNLVMAAILALSIIWLLVLNLGTTFRL